jgi:O-acetyl-ADP-ribose deacetylase (regulator of RNase III)
MQLASEMWKGQGQVAMRIALWDTNPEIVSAWARQFGPHKNVTFGCGDLLHARVDAVVSPANSFGFMDGGIDLAYRSFFGARVERRLRELIAMRPERELPVGQALVIPTGHPRITRLVVAPTMRMPMRIAGTNQAYLASWAAFKRASEVRDPPIETLGMPGMGTGIGAMDPEECSQQMEQAYVEVFGAMPTL